MGYTFAHTNACAFIEGESSTRFLGGQLREAEVQEERGRLLQNLQWQAGIFQLLELSVVPDTESAIRESG